MPGPMFNWRAVCAVFKGYRIEKTIYVYVKATTEASATEEAEESAELFYGDNVEVLRVGRIQL